MYTGRRDCEYACAGVQGPGLLKTAVSKINIQALTRFSKEEQGAMGDAGKNNHGSEVESAAKRRAEKTTQEKNKRQVFGKI